MAGYFDALLTFLDHAAEERFLRPEHRRLVVVAADAAALLGKPDRAQPPALTKWVDRPTT